MKLYYLLLLLAGLSFSACVEDATDTILFEQGTVIMAVVGLMMVVIALAYALGNALHIPNAIVFAKDEMYHLGFSMMLLLGFSGIVVFSCDLTGMFFTQTMSSIGGGSCYSTAMGQSPNEVAECYISLAKNDARSMSERYIQKYLDNMMDSTFAWSLSLPLFEAYTATAGAYKRIVSNEYSMIMNSFLVPALMSISMQKFVLLFINENIIRWVLPTAFVMRFFPPTRHMGNIFIAIAIGLYVLVPMLYAFNLSMYEVVMNDCSSFAKAACDNVIDNNSCSNPATTCGNPDSLWNVARLIPQAFFLPNLTMALVITFLSSVHKALRVIG
ncbi:MAG: hypothetical protein V1861_07100 [Candidatus Micrarchaeota archaeon]